MTVAFNQRHNFHQHDCRIIGQHIYYGGCQQRVARINEGTDAGRWPECASAVKGGTCPALRMMQEDFEASFSFGDGHGVKYYRDRDDCGPGVMKRAELGLPERSLTEIATHHAILAELSLAPYAGDGLTPRQKSILAERTAFTGIPESVKSVKPVKSVKAEKPDYASFDIGDLINQELENLKGAA